MNTLTHLGISQIIQKAVEDQLNIRLNRIGFMYGNIKPDISSSLVKIPHYKDESFEFIKQEILSLMNTRIYGSIKNVKKFSERLGVITHYLSDYFCHAHSKQFSGSMLDHHLYEIKLSQYCKSSPYLSTARELATADDAIYDYKSLFGYIDELHSIYARSSASFQADMSFALRICSLVALSILSVCIKLNSKTAA